MSVVFIHRYPTDLFSFFEFITSFFQVLTCFNGCVAAMGARLGFGTRLRWFCDCFVTVGFGENEHFAVILGSGTASVAMSPTATLL